VVDASIAAKWFFAEAGDEPARAVLASQNVLIAPDLIVAEVCNSAWKKVIRSECSVAQALEVATRLAQVFRELVAGSVLAPRALELAVQLRHPAYDCFYVALAELAEAELITADRALVRIARRAGIPARRIRLLGTRRATGD
jgi:predicted nucleic acid-binding protein